MIQEIASINWDEEAYGFNLEEEQRDGWTVTRKDKKVWCVELNMAKKLLEVCNRHNLICVAGYGTMLGAVRHNGFIPWDNDMDFLMPREDYKKLCTAYADEFTYPLFLQTVQREDNWYRGHAALRDSRTTCISKLDRNNKKCNNGIYIDIFPLDVEPNPKQKILESVFRFNVHLLNALCRVKAYGVDDEKKSKELFFKIARQVFLHRYTLKELDDKYNNLCSKFNYTKGNYRTLSFDYKKGTRFDFSFPQDYILDTIMMRFENTELPIPSMYDQWLTKAYGDYMKLPDIEKRRNDEEDIDPDTPYLIYLREEK